jgi:hypothetical protein
LRSAALVLVAAALVACSGGTPAPASLIQSPAQASDLRTQLDLLLTEHVMIVAKESAAALDSSSEYRAYAMLLTTNETTLTDLFRRAVGNAAAGDFSSAWTALNADLVDYAIQVATHDADKADAATGRLTDTTMPQLAGRLADITLGQPPQLLVMVTGEVTALRDTIDGAANHQYAGMYTSLENAVSAGTELGDVLAAGIVQRFSDRFPGDQTSEDAVRRAHLNVLMLERAYLITMTTDAQLNDRPTEGTQGLDALSANVDFIAAQVNDARLRQLWGDEMSAIQSYAKNGDATSRRALSDTIAGRLVLVTRAPASVVGNQLGATIKVIDDQRAKNSDDIASDDRAAATAMEPIADTL